MVDANNDGKLQEEEFKVLMVLAFEKQTEEEEIEDLDCFFDLAIILFTVNIYRSRKGRDGNRDKQICAKFVVRRHQ